LQFRWKLFVEPLFHGTSLLDANQPLPTHFASLFTVLGHKTRVLVEYPNQVAFIRSLEMVTLHWHGHRHRESPSALG